MEKHNVSGISIEKAFLLPSKVSKVIFTHARRVVSETTGLFLQTKSAKEFVQEIAGEHELDKAQQVMVQMEVGEQTEESMTIFEARADLARMVIDAREAPTIPNSVTKKLIEMAEQADISLHYEPKLDDEDQQRFAKIVTDCRIKPQIRHEIIVGVFPTEENKL